MLPTVVHPGIICYHRRCEEMETVSIGSPLHDNDRSSQPEGIAHSGDSDTRATDVFGSSNGG